MVVGGSAVITIPLGNSAYKRRGMSAGGKSGGDLINWRTGGQGEKEIRKADKKNQRKGLGG